MAALSRQSGVWRTNLSKYRVKSTAERPNQMGFRPDEQSSVGLQAEVSRWQMRAKDCKSGEEEAEEDKIRNFSTFTIILLFDEFKE